MKHYGLIFQKGTYFCLYKFDGDNLDTVMGSLIELIEQQIEKHGLSIIKYQQLFDEYVIKNNQNKIEKTLSLTDMAKFYILIDSDEMRLTLYRKETDDIINPSKLNGCKILMTQKFKD